MVWQALSRYRWIFLAFSFGSLLIFFQNCSQQFQLSDQNDVFFLSSSSASSFANFDRLGASKLTCRDPNQMSESTTRRLAKQEYINTVRDLFLPADVSVNADEQRSLPADAKSQYLLFDSAARGVSADHVEVYFSISERIVDEVLATESKASQLHACFANLGGQAAAAAEMCVQQFVVNFGKRIFRRPLQNEEVTQYLNLYREGLSVNLTRLVSVKTVLMAFLNSPQFIYLFEINGSDSDNGKLQLSPHELATRLSYLLWQTAPDGELLAEADSGRIMSGASLAAQTKRLMDDPRFRRVTEGFISRWLKLEGLVPPNFSAGFLAGVNPGEVRSAASIEALNFSNYIIHDVKGSYVDLLTSPQSSVTSQALAQVYLVPVTTDLQKKTPLPVGEMRGGLLTRAAFLYGGVDATSPIHRGAEIRRYVLCDPLPSPDPAQLPQGALQPPPFSLTQSSRERWTVKTSGSSCIGCHSQINDLGFAMEKFDTLGRLRQQERVVDPATAQTAHLAIDDQVDVMIEDTAVRVRGGLELSHAIAGSNKGNQCFARQWFRFSYGRMEDLFQDACLIKEMEEQLTVDRGSMLNMFQRLVFAPTFRLVRHKK